MCDAYCIVAAAYKIQVVKWIVSMSCLYEMRTSYDIGHNFGAEIPALNWTVLEASSWCCFVCAH